ncbi:MAG TPA: replicative DNA helicase [Candidatus Binatia bacterium]|nr:replicative DNA helicase [Candidatus Binatia bacterium]
MASVDENLRRVPPQSLEAEQSVLGGVLLDNAALDRVVELLDAEDFYREAHRRIFRAMLGLSERNEPVDLVTLAEVLRARGELAEVGGGAYLAELAERVPTAANVVNYARIVRDRSILRGLITAATEIATRGYDAPTDVSGLLDDAERRIFAISDREVRPAFVRIENVLTDTIKLIERLYEQKQAVTGVPTGFTDLDRITAGLQPSDLIIIAGRPSMGKTAFALNIAAHAAMHADRGVAIFSLEMSKEQLAMRLLCSEAQVDLARVRTGHLSDREFPQLAMAAGRLAETPIYIDDTPALSVLELRAKARRLKRESRARLGLVMVDYLQLMRSSEGKDSREQEISEISRSLKALAKELDVPVVALSQLNRQVENRNPPKPRLADLRESGAIEQDADVIAFIYRDEVYNEDSDKKNVAEIIVAKQRNGPTDSVELTFRREFTSFYNLELAPDNGTFAGAEGPEALGR